MSVLENRSVELRRRSDGRSSLRVLLAALLVGALCLVASPAEAEAGVSITRNDVVREWNEDGTAASGDEMIGHAILRRAADGLGVVVHAKGLRPGGVYTFWWIAVQGDGTFPDDIYVERAGGAVVGPSGTANIVAWTPLGDDGIEGFPVIGDASFASLHDPLGSLVRVEIAYHGQADEAGDDLDLWLSDFWSGAACPPQTPNPNPLQPHCPVYYAATFQP